ncbi:discoidin domain-containing protein [Paenibacillus aurantiacus]|uniref:Discoidin domain-containing protein n=1 Tax=Paenibacillus aurantiacus TaxID=1936118 RepID=A0ABV5KYC3_9BACL
MTTYHQEKFEYSDKYAMDFDRYFRNHMSNINDSFLQYDELAKYANVLGTTKFINRSTQFFGILSLSRLLTSMYLQNSKLYSDSLVYEAQQLAKSLESVKNNFIKIAFNPASMNLDALRQRFQKIKLMEESFLHHFMHEIRTGEKRDLQVIPPGKPIRLRCHRQTDSSLTMVWEKSDDCQDEMIDYVVTLNNTVVGSCGKLEYVIDNLEAKTSYEVEVQARNQFGTRSEAAVIVVSTEPFQSTGNLSQYRPAYASSSEQEDFDAVNVTDQNSFTRWSSQYKDEQWIYVDLGYVKQITRIMLHWEHACAKEYQVLISKDLATWNLIYETSEGFSGICELTNMQAAARYVRVNCVQRTSIYEFSLWEIGVFNDLQ